MDTNQQNEVYRKLKSLLSFGVLFLVVISVFFVLKIAEAAKTLPSAGSNIPPQTTITVSGMGKVTGVPDRAEFTFSVSNQAKQVSDAQSKTTTTMNSAISYLKSQGVPDKNITTSGYNIYPQYEYHDAVTGVLCPQYNCPNGSKGVIVGYNVDQTESVKVDDLTKVGDILSHLGSMGVTNLSGLSFTFQDNQKLTDQARSSAIDDAKAKAKTIADELGVHLVRITDFSESGNGPVYYPAAAGLGGGAKDMASTPVINPGENTVTSNVSITYEIN